MVLKIWKSQKWVKFEYFEKIALWENLLGLFIAILFVIFIFSPKTLFCSFLRKTNVFFIILDHFLQKRNRIEMPQIVRFRQYCRKTRLSFYFLLFGGLSHIFQEQDFINYLGWVNRQSVFLINRKCQKWGEMGNFDGIVFKLN